MDTYFVILEFHLQAGFEDAALIVEEADTGLVTFVHDARTRQIIYLLKYKFLI